jgi:hypothetical protein
VTANLVYVGLSTPNYQILPFYYFHVNNPNVSIIAAQRFIATVTGFTTVNQLNEVQVSVALVKGKFGAFETLSPKENGSFSNPAYVNGARRTNTSGYNTNLVQVTDRTVNQVFTVGQSTTIGLDWRYDSLELGVYTLCLVYTWLNTSYPIIQTQIPSINITCAPTF